MKEAKKLPDGKLIQKEKWIEALKKFRVFYVDTDRA